ncbi:anthrax toxin receptor-like [Camelus dromedarius]|uniref:Anthrax toxin receptor-like n=2 Tax=Camelus TaxID=9836 RepID=A0A9W3HG47_CAMBA|nr:anthrax toxin receptor-like [Camelus bactrianus]XP_032347544.1 anthrax toxin receptor-like [Camelus ferus]XP_045371774.1 anthrax toxin receptor-like [Camelus bactrianus]XP_045371775.1 anthrax toxin receptor-like [Camelus bactrianus]
MPPLPVTSPHTALTPSASTPPTQFVLYTNPLFLSWLIPALLLLMLLLWFICHLCCKKTVKEPPPTQERAKEPEETCPMQTCPTVIVPCGCQGGRMERMEGKLDHLCDFVQRCSQAPVMWRPPRAVGRCINVALMKPHCGQVPCGPKICVQPSRECFPIKNFCSRCQHPLSMCPRLPSRMLPLIHPPAPSYPIVLRK